MVLYDARSIFVDSINNKSRMSVAMNKDVLNIRKSLL